MRARILASFLDDEHRKWWTLLAVSFGLFMIMLDNTVVNVALPSIQRDLNVDVSELEWVVTGYALTFAVFMLTGGKLADLFGRRRIFIIGLVVFTLSSLACGLATNGEMLIARAGRPGSRRGADEPGDALDHHGDLPAAAARDGDRHLGGGLGGRARDRADHRRAARRDANWSWIFFINIPIGVFAILAARIVIRETKDTSLEQRLDLPGLATSGAGLFALTYALIEANTNGWTSPEILSLFGVAVAGFAAFIALERRQRAPMLDLSLFRNRTFTGANLAMLLVALSMFGVFFFVSLFVQNILGYSPVQAGAAFLPMTLCIIFIAPVAGKLSDLIGSRWLIGAGMVLVAVSLVLFSLLDESSTFWNLFPALLVGGVGMALAMTPTTSAAMSSVPVDKAGVGSGRAEQLAPGRRRRSGSRSWGRSSAPTSTSRGRAQTSRASSSTGFSLRSRVAAGIAFAAAVVAVLSW